MQILPPTLSEGRHTCSGEEGVHVVFRCSTEALVGSLASAILEAPALAMKGEAQLGAVLILWENSRVTGNHITEGLAIGRPPIDDPLHGSVVHN